jgi:tetratricopeptide (TPR) repeat protein
MLTLALVLQAAAPAVSDAALYRDCVAAAEAGAPGAIDAAGRWVNANGGVPARHCLGLAYMGAGKPIEASGSVEAGALYGQAGSAALAGGDAARAEALLTAAILAERKPDAKGELHVDRAAAREAAGNVAGAKADLEAGLVLAPGSAGGWLLQAVLARREERIADARAAIEKALALAPGDPDIRLEAGNAAAYAGDFARARTLWSAVVRDSPGTEAAKAADLALLRNPG